MFISKKHLSRRTVLRGLSASISLPLLDAHAALAGYADLWVAVTLGLASLAWTRWLLWRERGQWLLGVGLALCLPAIKLEGAVWLLMFSAVVVLDLLPSRWRWRVAGGVAAIGGVGGEVDRDGPGRGVVGGVAAGAADQGVRPATARQNVVAGATLQDCSPRRCR